MEYELYKTVMLKDGRKAAVVDRLGPDYVVDVGEDETDWDTIIVKQEDIIGLVEE